ncbi:hypothetical protein R1sor_016205 [Riccia sorocarpa]|uniref:Protein DETOXIFICATION n=1 Tax=Riccia sorocarpa TaxID=122646 RepID=A0ABD3HG66_9MARC
MENHQGRQALLDGWQDSQVSRTTNGGSGGWKDGIPGAPTDPFLQQERWVPSFWKKLKKDEIRQEANEQLSLALPMVLVNILQTALLVIPLTFVGHYGELELASAALANSIASVLGLYILLGMASALETLCGQAFGAERYHMLEIYLQRAVFVLLCICVPMTVLYLNIERVLLLVGQAPEISAKSAEYVRYLIPVLFANAFLQPLVKFLQTQSIVKPMVWCGVITVVLHVGLTWLCVHLLGYMGGAVATSISFWLNLLILGGYLKWSNSCEETSIYVYRKEVFSDIGNFLKLALSSAVMICLEYWSFEALVLTAGLLANPQLELSALSICLNTITLNYMIPLGLSAAASTRVSNELGAGNPNEARRAVIVALTISLLQSLVVSMAFFLSRHVWGSIFSSDRELVDYVATIMPFLSVVCILDGFQGVLSGVIRGAGWQGLAAIINLLAFYGVGLPFGLFTAFPLGWAAKGLLSGLLLGLGLQATIFGILTLRTDWDKEAEAAYQRQVQASLKDEIDSV